MSGRRDLRWRATTVRGNRRFPAIRPLACPFPPETPKLMFNSYLSGRHGKHPHGGEVPQMSAGATVRTPAGAQSWTYENFYALAGSPKYTETPSRQCKSERLKI
jgi:hypothetical protein